MFCDIWLLQATELTAYTGYVGILFPGNKETDTQAISLATA